MFGSRRSMLMLAAAALAAVAAVNSAATPAAAQSNQFACNGGVEDFEGTWDFSNPLPGWDITYSSTYGAWTRATGGEAYGAEFAGAFAWSYYGDFALSSSLVTPVFSTEGTSEVVARFSGYFYLYSGYGNRCDLRYSVDGQSGPWNTVTTWGSYGGPQVEAVALPAAALGEPDVALRWHRYTNTYAYYWAMLDTLQLQWIGDDP